MYHERLRRLLKCQQSLALPPHAFVRPLELRVDDIYLIGADFSDQSRKGEFAKQQVGGFLVFADFAEGDGARSEFVDFARGEGVAGLDAG